MTFYSAKNRVFHVKCKLTSHFFKAPFSVETDELFFFVMIYSQLAIVEYA